MSHGIDDNGSLAAAFLYYWRALDGRLLRTWGEVVQAILQDNVRVTE